MPTAGDKNVSWLDIAVNDAFGVGGVERVGDFDAKVDKLLGRKRASQHPVLESLALQVLHHNERLTLVLADFVDGTDIGMIQGGGSAGFAAKAFERLRVGSGGLRKK